MAKRKNTFFKHPAVIAGIGALGIIIGALITSYLNKDQEKSNVNSGNIIENNQKIDSGEINNQIEIIKDDKIDNSKSITIDKVTGDFINGDKKVHQVFNTDNKPHNIETILIETRLTCSMKNNESFPPTKYGFTPANRVTADFIGSAGTIGVDFQSPIYFRRLEDNQVVIINNYSLRNGSYIQHRPLTILNNYDSLYIPIVTVVYGKKFKQINLLEITVRINGDDFWYASYKYKNTPFEILEGNQFGVSLTEFRAKLSEYLKNDKTNN